MEYLVVGGGPAGLIEAQRLSAIGKEVTLVSPQWGGIMECMGNIICSHTSTSLNSWK